MSRLGVRFLQYEYWSVAVSAFAAGRCELFVDVAA